MSEEPEKLVEGTLISHLLELRDRLIRAMIAVAVAFLPCMFYSNQLFTFVATPLKEKLPKGTQLIATTVMSPFTTPFKLSLFVAVFLAMPFIIYQLWAFVAPGLYRHEKRFAVPLLISSIVLFYVGVVFAYFFVFPVMFQFFAATTPHGVAMMTDISAFNFSNDVEFATYLVKDIGIACVPGSSFYKHPKDGSQQVRFAFCKKPETLHEAARRLEKLRQK